MSMNSSPLANRRLSSCGLSLSIDIDVCAMVSPRPGCLTDPNSKRSERRSRIWASRYPGGGGKGVARDITLSVERGPAHVVQMLDESRGCGGAVDPIRDNTKALRMYDGKEVG